MKNEWVILCVYIYTHTHTHTVVAKSEARRVHLFLMTLQVLLHHKGKIFDFTFIF